jgi:hypothetical protein
MTSENDVEKGMFFGLAKNQTNFFCTAKEAKLLGWLHSAVKISNQQAVAAERP